MNKYLIVLLRSIQWAHIGFDLTPWRSKLGFAHLGSISLILTCTCSSCGTWLGTTSGLFRLHSGPVELKHINIESTMNSAQNKSNAETSAIKAGSHKRGSYFDDYVKLTQNKASQFDGTSFNIWDYLRVEMFGVGEPGNLEPPSKEHLQNFFLVPLYLEGLVFLGFFICMDAFLYVITYLPIRVMFSLYLFIVECYTYSLKFGLGGIINTLLFSETNQKRRLRFHRTHTYDLMRGAMFAVGCIALRQVNMSQVYHLIRGQSMIKLYVLASMIEVFDKLMSSFGQDAFDALHWQTRYNPRSLKMALTFLMTTGYVCIHSLIYFFHIATMTVVINSVDKALITVLILNNFSEMKAFILKKFDCNNLFQLACSDINERFQMFLFLTLVFIVALAQEGTDWMSTVKHFAHIAGLMLLGECVADWMKHAFINKFNFINATVYEDFAYVLRGDILTNQKDEIILDHTYSVTRRLGLSQVSLTAAPKCSLTPHHDYFHDLLFLYQSYSIINFS